MRGLVAFDLWQWIAPGCDASRPADTLGLVVEVKRRPEQTESLLWFCDRCDRLLHRMTMHVADIERELKAAIEHFDASLALRTCRGCGHVQPERAPAVVPVTSEGRLP